MKCQFGGKATRACGSSNNWTETDWTRCNSVLTADIHNFTNNRSENPGEILHILSRLVNLTSNATLLSMQDIKTVVRYVGLNQTSPITENSLAVISNILSADPEVTKGVKLEVISRIIRTLVETSRNFCTDRRLRVTFKQLTLTCAGWFNVSGQDSILAINKNSGLLHRYRQDNQFSDFIIVVGGEIIGSDDDLWDSSQVFPKIGSGCVVVDTVSGLANSSKCVISGGRPCKCYHRNGMVVMTTGPTLTDGSQITVQQICHVVAMAILLLTILGLLCKGFLSNPQTAINLNLTTTAFLAQTVLLIQTFPVDTTTAKIFGNFVTDELPKGWINLNLTSKSCLIVTLVSDHIHPTFLGWSLMASVALLKSLDPSIVMKSQTRGNILVAKLAVLIYLLPLIFPISRWIYCSLADSASVGTCLTDSSVSCMKSISGVEDVRLYTHFLPIASLILAHLISIIGTLGAVYRFRKKAGAVESRTRTKMSFLCLIPTCVLYLLYCVQAAIYWQTEILTAFAVFSVVFALMVSVGVIGSIKLSYGFVQFEIHSGSKNGKLGLKVTRTA